MPKRNLPAPDFPLSGRFRQVREIFKRHTHLIEPLSLDDYLMFREQDRPACRITAVRKLSARVRCRL
jgi:hypothetical protein